MGIELPNSGNVFLPVVPSAQELSSPAMVKRTLDDFRRHIEMMGNALFANDIVMATAMNLGTSGTFTLSSGGSIIITSGIVRTVTS